MTRITSYLLPLTCYLFLITSSPAAFPPLRWEADTSVPKTAAFSAYRGETKRFAPVYVAGGAPVNTNGLICTFYWSTNGVLWWSKGLGPDPGLTVTGDPFEWTPQMDCGAARYSFFIRAASQDAAVSYAANGTLRMLGSPGAAPNALPLPARSIDFSEISFTNAPWATPDDLQAASNALAGALQPLGPRLDLIESNTSRWDAAWSWGPHFAAGYLLPADLAPYATTQQVATAVSGKLDAAASNATLRAEWFPDVYGTGEGHLRIVDTSTDEAVYLGPLGFGQWRRADGENPSGIDRFVNWYDVPERWEIAAASNNLAHVIGALKAADVGALPSTGEPAGLAVEWKANVYPETERGHLRIFDPLSMSEILIGPHGFGQWRTSDEEYPGGIDRYVPWASLITHDDMTAITNYVPLDEKELHRDSFTNLVWKSVYSNGWHFLVAFTNTPGGSE